MCGYFVTRCELFGAERPNGCIVQRQFDVSSIMLFIRILSFVPIEYISPKFVPLASNARKILGCKRIKVYILSRAVADIENIPESVRSAAPG